MYIYTVSTWKCELFYFSRFLLNHGNIYIAFYIAKWNDRSISMKVKFTIREPVSTNLLVLIWAALYIYNKLTIQTNTYCTVALFIFVCTIYFGDFPKKQFLSASKCVDLIVIHSLYFGFHIRWNLVLENWPEISRKISAPTIIDDFTVLAWNQL